MCWRTPRSLVAVSPCNSRKTQRLVNASAVLLSHVVRAAAAQVSGGSTSSPVLTGRVQIVHPLERTNINLIAPGKR
jgi:hypothetical protein